MRNSIENILRTLLLNLFLNGWGGLLFSQTFDGQPNMLIPPGAPSQLSGITESTCTVSGIGVLGGCYQIDHVTIDLVYPVDADLGIYLIGPGGEILDLSTGNGGSGDNYTNTIFTDNTTPFITSGTAPFTGTFRPEGRNPDYIPPIPPNMPLGTYTFANTFNGIDADGEWTLLITDYVPLDWGELLSWSITFVGDTPPTVTISVAPSSICAGQNSVVTLTFSEPTPPGVHFDGLITSSTGANFPFNDIVPAGLTWNLTVSPTVSQTYTLASITSSTDCPPIIGTPNSASIEVNPIPIAAISGDLSICTGESTTLTATGGDSFAWSTGTTDNPISVSPTANQSYSVTVSENGCSSQTSATVTVQSPPTISLSAPPTVCDGGCQTITASLTGVAPFSFSYEFQSGGNLVGPGESLDSGSSSIQFLACPPAGSPSPVQVVICTLTDQNCSL